jgi:16S rRNA (adenine1518-N6/adenine1519-N6)-dimethyltransferase
MDKKKLDKSIGQHLLIDQEAMSNVIESIPRNLNVMEIGAGSGLLTKHLVKRSRRVVAVEIDKGFEEDLKGLARRHKNLKVVYGNALDLLSPKLFKKLMPGHKNENWIAGNIPYHITEPLMMKLIHLPIQGATFLIGIRFANKIIASFNSPDFGKLTLLVNTFFLPEIRDYVNRKNFDPPPRTTSAVVVLTTKSDQEILSSQDNYLLSNLFLSSGRGIKLKNVLREAIIRYVQYTITGTTEISNKPIVTKNDARKKIEDLGFSDLTLNKSIEQLSNPEFKQLVQKIHQLHLT